MAEKLNATLDQHRALVRGFIDGTLSGEENAALEIHLRDADIARHFLRELHFDQAIHVTAKSQIRRAEIEAAPNAAHPVTARLRVRRPNRWRAKLPTWSWARAATVLVILGLSTWVIQALPVKPPTAAELMVHLGTVEVGGEARNGASSIREGQDLLVSPKGWASLRLRDGTLIELASGTQVALTNSDTGMRVQLNHGSVQADVRKQLSGRPLVFASSRAHATVLGTRLQFATTADGDRLEVSEGLVRLARGDDHIDVPAGQAVAVGSTGALALQPLRPPVAPMPEPPRAGLVLWLDPAHGVTRDERGLVARWDDRSGNGHAVANLTQEQRPAVITSGRPAIRFGARDDMLSGTIPWPTTGAFTVAVALRASDLGRWSQTFGWGWGCFTFHAQENGGIFAGVGAPGGGIRFSPGAGPEDIAPGTAVIGRWQQFIVTYGHGVGAFYADGKLIARKAMPLPQSHAEFRIGRAEPDPGEPFSFAGDLGELLLYERLLDQQEISVLDHRLRGAP